jgi:hypothetical protein
MNTVETRPAPKIHLERNIKHLREMLGVKELYERLSTAEKEKVAML